MIMKSRYKGKVTTLKKLSIIEKEPANETLFVNGAPDGMISEPDFEIFSIIDTEETALLLRRVEKLIAA